MEVAEMTAGVADAYCGGTRFKLIQRFFLCLAPTLSNGGVPPVMFYQAKATAKSESTFKWKKVPLL